MVCPMWCQCLHFGCALELPMQKRLELLLYDAYAVFLPFKQGSLY